MADQFAHLHVHTEYSMLDGYAKFKKLLAEAERLSMPAVAMTDHGNMHGAYDLWKAAKSSPVRPVLGIEAYVAPESRFHKQRMQWGSGRASDAEEGSKDIGGGGRYLHMTMLAVNATGLRNLFKLSSEAWMTGQYPAGKPRMDLELMAQHAEGIVVTTGCAGGAVPTRLRLGQEREALEYAARLREIFGRDNVFAELMDHGLAIERTYRSGLLSVAEKLNMPLLVTNDSHYVTADEAPAHDALLAVGVAKNLDDPNRFRFEGDSYYLRSAEEMHGLDSSEPWVQGCRNTLLVAERVTDGAYDEVFEPRKLMPEFDVPAGETQDSWLRKEVERLLPTRYPSGASQAVRGRIEHEIDIITRTGWSAYFLVVADICHWAKANGIAVGPGRGSATGSIVMYILGVTGLDPLEHSLLFERFLNPDRVSPPDADLDFDERRRGDVIRYVTKKYGVERVSMIVTFGVLRARQAIKDACRILGMPYATGDRLNKAMPSPLYGEPVSLPDIFDKTNPRYAEAEPFRAMCEADQNAQQIVEVARSIEGTIRGSGVHGAGVVVAAQPLAELIPMTKRERDGVVIAGFAFPQLEDMGLLKIDFLGLRNLTVLQDAVAGIKANRGVELDLEELPFDDQPTFDLLAKGETLGVFQLDGLPIRQLLRAMRPTRFEDISATIALYRPGPLTAGAHTAYADRKTGKHPVVPIHPELKEALEPILGETYHLVVYQEQVMQVARELAGYTLAQADLLRRAMGKKKPEILDKELERFTQGMAANGFSRSATQAIWDVLVPFSGYGFNRSHSAGYAVIAYWTAYLKANYPAEFMAALLTSIDDKGKMALYLGEARRMGVKLLSPDVNESAASFTAIGEDVRFGLGAVSNVGAAVLTALLSTRREVGKFNSFDEFLAKVPAKACNKRVVESLILAGAFDSLGHTRLGLYERMDRALAVAADAKRYEEAGQLDMFADEPAPEPPAESNREWPLALRLQREREVLGRYVSSHPLEGSQGILKDARDATVAQVLERAQSPEESAAQPEVTIAGLVTAVERRYTKANGAPWATVTVEDLTGSVLVTVFPQSWRLYQYILIEDAVVAVTGKLEVRDDDSVSLVAQTASQLDTKDGTEPVVLEVDERAVTAKLTGQLRQLFCDHPGPRPVHLALRQGPGKTVVLECESKVDGGSGFAADVKALLGSAVLRGA